MPNDLDRKSSNASDFHSRADFVALGMGKSYQALSRRIAALQELRIFSRRRLGFTMTALALLGALAIIPWRLAAQEAKPKAQPELPAQASSEPPAEKKPTPAELLVGIWRGGPREKNIVFYAGGRFQDLGANAFVQVRRFSAGGSYNEVNIPGQGDWKIDGESLILNFDNPGKFWHPTTTKPGPGSQGFQILRLDDSRLRIRNNSEVTHFFRRIEQEPIEKRFANIPAEYRQICDAAQLTPEEATVLVDWFQSAHVDTASLRTLDRVLQTRSRKIPLTELLDMSADEADAFIALAKEINGRYERLGALNTAGQLTPIEVKGSEKFGSIMGLLSALKLAIPEEGRDPPIDRGGFGRPRRNVAPPTLKSNEIPVVRKFSEFLNDIDGWFQGTVLQQY